MSKCVLLDSLLLYFSLQIRRTKLSECPYWYAPFCIPVSRSGIFRWKNCRQILRDERVLRFTIKLQIHITQNTLHAFTARHVFMCHEEKISIHSMYRLQASRTCALPTFLTDLHENRTIRAFVIISFTFSCMPLKELLVVRNACLSFKKLPL